MQIPSFSKFLAFPFVLLIIFFFTKGRFMSAYIDTWTLIPSVMCLVLLYVFNEQIDKWWWTKYPPTLDPKLKSWISVYSQVYKDFDSELKQKFEQRISLFIRLKDFTLKAKKDFHLEEDIKTLIAHEFVRLTLYRDDYLLKPYDRFVVYNHPFGTPDYPFLHSFEYQQEDGVVIFSREQLINGFNQALDFFNIGIYGAICVFISIHPRLDYPDVTTHNLENICSTVGINLESIINTLGYKEITKLSLLIYVYLQYSDKTREAFPVDSEKIRAILNQ